MSKHIKTNQAKDYDAVRGGFSDIRLWPAYTVLSLAALGLAPFIGLFLATILIGAPLFVLTIRASGVTKHDATTPKRWQIPVQSQVYSAIRDGDTAFDKNNALLRRNMKIIQEDERTAKHTKMRKPVHLAYLTKQG